MKMRKKFSKVTGSLLQANFRKKKWRSKKSKRNRQHSSYSSLFFMFFAYNIPGHKTYENCHCIIAAGRNWIFCTSQIQSHEYLPQKSWHPTKLPGAPGVSRFFHQQHIPNVPWENQFTRWHESFHACHGTNTTCTTLLRKCTVTWTIRRFSSKNGSQRGRREHTTAMNWPSVSLRTSSSTQNYLPWMRRTILPYQSLTTPNSSDDLTLLFSAPTFVLPSTLHDSSAHTARSRWTARR